MLHALQLFLGETNRTLSETPMNMASSRSHCIFTLHVESRQVTHVCPPEGQEFTLQVCSCLPVM